MKAAKPMKRKYSDCYYCGGAVEEQQLPRELRWQGDLYIIENVPMGVCVQCGEKVVKPSVAKELDGILKNRRKPARTIQVPVYRYKAVIA